MVFGLLLVAGLLSFFCINSICLAMATHKQVFVRKDVPKLWGLINRHWLVGFDVLPCCTCVYIMFCLPTPTGRPLCGNGSTFVKAFLKTVNIWHLLCAGRGKKDRRMGSVGQGFAQAEAGTMTKCELPVPMFKLPLWVVVTVAELPMSVQVSFVVAL